MTSEGDKIKNYARDDNGDKVYSFDVLVKTMVDDLVTQLKNKSQTNPDHACPSLQKVLTMPHLDPEINMNTSQIIHSYGYPSEEHTVVTSDGYILGIQRIPYGYKGNQTHKYNGGSRYPVLLLHGLLGSSSDWIINPPHQSLGFILADAGFDVWLGNFRGNTYSRRHIHLNPDERAFWEFSWDEMASLDLPSMIMYILNTTKHDDLFYVGHSEGTLTAFAEFSRNQKLASKIRMFFSLAPVTTVGHTAKPLIKRIASYVAQIADLLYALGFKGEYMPKSDVIEWLVLHFCVQSPPIICERIISIIGGINCKHLNVTRLPVYLSHGPAGTSIQNIVHLAQMVQSNKFQMYDYGSSVDNMNHYNQSIPPLYDVSRLRTPIALYWGGEDQQADPTDVVGLIEKLSHIEHNKYISIFHHIDFIFSPSAVFYCYNDMVDVMNKELM